MSIEIDRLRTAYAAHPTQDNWDAIVSALSPAPIQSAEVAAALEALRFYAEGQHFVLHDPDVFDTVSGEPQNWQEDESNTIMFEDGSVAKLALDALAATPAQPFPFEAIEHGTLKREAFASDMFYAAYLAERRDAQPIADVSAPTDFPLMRSAICGLRCEGVGDAGRYTMEFRFKSIAELHRANDEWQAARAAAPVSGPTDTLTYTVDGVRMSPLEYISHLHDLLQKAAPVSGPTIGKPDAWLVPHLLSFAGARTSCPPDAIPELEGTVAWGAEVFSDGGGVTDKHGVEHKPIPLFRPAAAILAAPVSGQGAPVEIFKWRTREGKQHDTGRVTYANGGFFADTASPADAERIANALNIDSRPRSEDSRAPIPSWKDRARYDKVVVVDAATASKYMEAEIADLRNRLASSEAPGSSGEVAYPSVRLTRDRYEMCEVSLRIGGRWVVVLRDNGTMIDHSVAPTAVKRHFAAPATPANSAQGEG